MVGIDLLCPCQCSICHHVINRQRQFAIHQSPFDIFSVPIQLHSSSCTADWNLIDVTKNDVTDDEPPVFIKKTVKNLPFWKMNTRLNNKKKKKNKNSIHRNLEECCIIRIGFNFPIKILKSRHFSGRFRPVFYQLVSRQLRPHPPGEGHGVTGKKEVCIDDLPIYHARRQQEKWASFQ